MLFLFPRNKKIICRHHADLFEDVYKEFNNNLLYIYIDGRYIETKYFKEAVLCLLFNICELNPTGKVGSMVHGFLKLSFFEKPEYREGVYKQIRYEILPVLWKNHQMIERKKQRKLTFLADELHGVGRTVEAHIIRTIVKPYIRDLNKKWFRMIALEKLKAVLPLLGK